MAFYRRSGGGWAGTSIMYRRSGGAWAQIQNIYRRAGGAWALVWQAYTNVTASANSISNFASDKGTFTIGTSTATGFNGTGSYSYSLSFVSGTQFAYTLVAANQARFTATNTVAGTPVHKEGIYRWTVSDGRTSATADFHVSWN